MTDFYIPTWTDNAEQDFENRKIADALSQKDLIHFTKSEPAKFIDGQIYLAPGDPAWDPGSGKGLYIALDGVYKRLDITGNTQLGIYDQVTDTPTLDCSPDPQDVLPGDFWICNATGACVSLCPNINGVVAGPGDQIIWTGTAWEVLTASQGYLSSIVDDSAAGHITLNAGGTSNVAPTLPAHLARKAEVDAVQSSSDAADTVQDSRLDDLEQWDIDHLAAGDPHPQYLIPADLPQVAASYLLSTTVNNPPDYDLTNIQPTGPASGISITVNADDVLCGRFTNTPIQQDLLYAELETRCVLDLSGESRNTFVYVKSILNLSGGGTTELGTSGSLLLQENRGLYAFTIQILGPVQATAGDFISIEVYGTKDGGGPSRTVEIWVDHGVSRNITFLPIPSYPAEHGPSHNELGTDPIPDLDNAIAVNEQQDARLDALEALPPMRMIVPYTPGQDVLWGSVVQSSGYLMHANKDTSEPAAPTPIGDPSYAFDGTLAPFSQSAKTVIFGQRYTPENDLYVTKVRIDVITGFYYRLFYVRDPLTTPIFLEILSFGATTTGWVEFSIIQAIRPSGEMFDIIASMSEIDDTPDTFVGNWDYQTPTNVATPAIGQAIQSNKALDTLNISYTDDDAGDRTVELQGLVVGDKISAQGINWTINASTIEITYQRLIISPTSQLPIDAITEFTFEIVTPTELSIGRDLNYWLGNVAVAGLYIADGVYTDIVPDDNAYGIDIQIQQINASEDWDYMAFSE